MKSIFPKKDVRNPTTRTGKIVHAPGPSGFLGAYPMCLQYVRGLMYTDAEVNCRACLSTPAVQQTRSKTGPTNG